MKKLYAALQYSSSLAGVHRVVAFKMDGNLADNEQVPVRITLQKIQPGDFTLMKAGFKWVNDHPNNR